MTLLFLDIDGVMNSIQSNDRAKALRQSGKSIPRLCEEFAPWSVDALNAITGHAGAQIVISSTWRESAIPHLRRVGVRGNIVGATPLLERYNGSIYLGVTRGQEIAAYLTSEKERPGAEPITAFVILDDDGDMEPFMSHLVRTSPYTCGLSACHIEPAIAVLQGEI